MARSRKEGEDRVAEILHEAEAARVKGDFQKNKKLLDEATAIYTRAGNYAAAAEVAEHLKDHARAARYWFRSGDFKRAAKEHLAAGEYQQAVELFERSGDYMKAAEVLEAEGDLIRASMQYEKAGDPLRAADILWDALNEPGVSVTAPEAQEACNRAGKLYADLGRLDQAIEAFSRGGNIKKTAQILEKAQRFDAAIELLSKAGDLLGAAEVARNAKMEDRASILLALRAENAGRPSEAAAHYEQAGQYGQAAMLYEFGGDMARAAEAHERAGNLETAASIYQRIGEIQRAIRCLRAIGRDVEADRVSWDPDTSAVREIYDDGDYLQAARGFINAARNGRPHCYDEAMHCLELIEDGASFLEAQGLIAEVLEERNDHRGAIAVLRKVVDPLTPAEEHCPLLYQYGRLLESEGFFAEARGVYRSIVVLNPRYGDVTDRMRYIADRVEPAPSIRTIVGTPAAAPPPASSMAESTPSGDVFDEDSTEEIDTEAIVGEFRGRGASGVDSGDIFSFATPRTLEGIVLRKRFRIERQLGGGGQARVFLARDTVLDRPVAIKVLHESVAASETGLEKFLREARLAARIHHPSCVAIFDFGHERGLTFIAMEFIEGRSLGDRLLEGSIDELRSLEIAKEVADALGAAHAAGVIHRDVKPGNILIDEADRIRLTDFGVARVLDGDVTGGLFTGTPKYMSPEQANGDLVDSRTDLYSLGAVLFEMIAGTAPFDGSLASVAVRLTQPAPDLPISLGVSERTRRIVRSCLSRDRRDRPASAEALIHDLDGVIAEITRRVMSRM